MAMKLSTTLGHINNIPNALNAAIIKDFYEYLKGIETSENYQNQNIKQLIGYVRFLGKEITFLEIQKKEQIISFLGTKIKNSSDDADKKWITTWNDYLWRIKYFFRWLHNYKLVKEIGSEPQAIYNWITPPFLEIKKKKTKRISPYLETELWDRDELFATAVTHKR
jgi:hypothetical protein